ncbi:Periodic tryptophan protein 1 homolog [Geodia barretti]|uniref:Periodic tryptophan protein 1 homolog n=1 Tax=Geodia barretti TaxID=519541 RepID=A0AA35RCC1_GEOBA|nr:Periodic tryptophan protein 1 homolog [Geodia barretti]
MASGGGSSLVPCVCWVPKGASKENPDKVELSQEELQELMMKEAQEQMRGLDVSQKKEGEEGAGVERSVEEEYNLSQYSSDESGGEGEKMTGAGMGNGLAGLAYFASNDSDPYITLKNPPPEDNEEDDFKILSTENLLIVGRADDEFSSVEVHVFSDDDFHCYCHHEILLTSFPLAMEWMDFDPGEPDKKGSYLVVGMMTPGIEVWDLDLVDGLEPILTLGPSTLDLAMKSSRKSKKKKKGGGDSGASGDSGEGHSDAVLGLAWNSIVRTALASCSADKTVRIWDMCGPKCVLTLPHPDKVQCLQWHPYDPQLLATGAYDGRVRLFNCVASQNKTREWKLDGEVERLLWNHLKPDHLLASTDGHTVHCLDRNADSAVFQIHAHTDAICDLSLSCYMPGLLVTASTDDTIKFWDIQDDKPVFLLSRSMHMGLLWLCREQCCVPGFVWTLRMSWQWAEPGMGFRPLTSEDWYRLLRDSEEET